MKKLRYGIIGCGMIAEMHALSVENDDWAQLVAVCDNGVTPQLEAFAARHGAPRVYGSYSEMLAGQPMDIVSVCTPSGLHGACTLAALNSGVHVLCEKPLEITREKMNAMIETARQKNLWLGCVFPNRTRRGLQRAKQIIGSGALGRPVLVECHYTGYRSPEYFSGSGWKGTKAMDGGGCLMNQGIHAVDTMCWLAGDAVSVYGVAATMLRPIEVEDLAAGVIEFASGAKGVLVGTTLSNIPENGPEGDRLKLEYEHGSILYADGKTSLHRREGDAVTVTGLDDPGGQVVSSGADATRVDFEAHSAIVSDMIDAVLDNHPPCIPGYAARKSTDLILALYASAAQGRKILL